jgi:hypothetical protein
MLCACSIVTLACPGKGETHRTQNALIAQSRCNEVINTDKASARLALLP